MHITYSKYIILLFLWMPYFKEEIFQIPMRRETTKKSRDYGARSCTKGWINVSGDQLWFTRAVIQLMQKNGLLPYISIFFYVRNDLLLLF